VRGRHGRNTGRSVTIAICVAVFVLGVAGAVAYRLAHRHDLTTPPPAATTTITVPPKVAVTDPATVVREFFSDINNRRYLAAWQLTPEKEPFEKFRAGFAGTTQDTVNIESVNGNVVTVTLIALQANGSVKNYAGTYTVTNGIISSASVRQTS
jgi:hypothetical protein